jgi:hypothetical protein
VYNFASGGSLTLVANWGPLQYESTVNELRTFLRKRTFDYALVGEPHACNKDTVTRLFDPVAGRDDPSKSRWDSCPADNDEHAAKVMSESEDCAAAFPDDNGEQRRCATGSSGWAHKFWSAFRDYGPSNRTSAFKPPCWSTSCADENDKSPSRPALVFDARPTAELLSCAAEPLSGLSGDPANACSGAADVCQDCACASPDLNKQADGSTQCAIVCDTQHNCLQGPALALAKGAIDHIFDAAFGAHQRLALQVGKLPSKQQQAEPAQHIRLLQATQPPGLHGESSSGQPQQIQLLPALAALPGKRSDPAAPYAVLPNTHGDTPFMTACFNVEYDMGLVGEKISEAAASGKGECCSRCDSTTHCVAWELDIKEQCALFASVDAYVEDRVGSVHAHKEERNGAAEILAQSQSTDDVCAEVEQDRNDRVLEDVDFLGSARRNATTDTMNEITSFRSLDGLSRTNLVYVKCPKTGSSTAAGTNRRIAAHSGLNGVTSGYHWITVEKSGSAGYGLAGYDKYGVVGYKDKYAHTGEPGAWSCHKKRHDMMLKPPEVLKMRTYFWTIMRRPLDRAMSSFYMSAQRNPTHNPNTVAAKLEHLAEYMSPMFDYFRTKKTKSAAELFKAYNLIGTIENYAGTLTVLASDLGIPLGDVLSLPAKENGVDGKWKDEHAAGARVVHIPWEEEPQQVQEYLKTFEKNNRLDYLLWETATKQLDRLIAADPQKKLAFKAMQHTLPLAKKVCAHDSTPKPDSRNCYWRDNGCAFQCLDKQQDKQLQMPCPWCKGR